MHEAAPRARAPMSTLIVVCAVAPTSMNIFLPALPAIQADFAVETGTAQLVVSLAFVFIALATLAYGPLSDRHGRRPVLLAGLGLFVLGSAICIVAPTISILIAGRVIQAAGGAAGLVLTRAMVRDLYDREQTARMLALLNMAMIISPMLAPFVGGLLTEVMSWRAIFGLMAAAGALIALDVHLRLPETRRGGSELSGIVSMVRGFGGLLRSPAFCGYATQAAFLLAMFYVFTATTPYIMAHALGRPPTEFGLYFMLLSAGYLLGSFVSTHLSPRLGIDRTILVGSLCCVLGAAGVFALGVGGIWGPLALFLPLTVSTFANGLTQPNILAGAVSINPALAGSASGFLTFIQMTVAAIATQLVGMLDHGTPVPLGASLLFMAVTALVAFVFAMRLERSRPTRSGA